MRSEPLMRVGAGFGLNRYSSVSSAVMRVKVKLQKDRKFKDRLEYIANNILKGQTTTPILFANALRPIAFAPSLALVFITKVWRICFCKSTR